MNSSNGVFINNRKIHRSQVLVDNDTIKIGKEEFVFRIDNSTDVADTNLLEVPSADGLQKNRFSGPLKSYFEDFLGGRPARLSFYKRDRHSKVVDDQLYKMVSISHDEENPNHQMITHSETGVNINDNVLPNSAEIEANDFLPVKDIQSIETLKADYEKLRLAYQISQISIADDLQTLLQKLLDLVFSVIDEIDRGVVLLVDKEKSSLSIRAVKLRNNQKLSDDEKIILSVTVMVKPYDKSNLAMGCRSQNKSGSYRFSHYARIQKIRLGIQR
jgi:adenylate cyclase